MTSLSLFTPEVSPDPGTPSGSWWSPDVPAVLSPLALAILRLRRGVPRGGIHVPPLAGSAAGTRTLEEAIRLLRERLPGIGGIERKISMQLRPGGPGWKPESGLAETVHYPPGPGWPAEWSAVTKIAPQVWREGPEAVLPTLVHEALHPVVGPRVQRLWETPRGQAILSRVRRKAAETISDDAFQRVMRNPKDYGGPFLSEELLVRLMEHNIARRRLNLPWALWP